MVRRKAIYPVEVGNVGRGQDADRSDQELRTRTHALFHFNLPAFFHLVIVRRDDLGIELDVAAQVEFVRHVFEVTQRFWLGGKVLAPFPFLQ